MPLLNGQSCTTLRVVFIAIIWITRLYLLYWTPVTVQMCCTVTDSYLFACCSICHRQIKG